MSKFEQALIRLLKEEIDRRTVQVASGTVQSFEDYKFQVGVINGLILALTEAIPEAHKEVNAEHRS